jgi:glycosyltransferase involved in cell wall biosynthesis
MKLLFYYWTLSHGGVQHMMANLAAEFVRRGHQVVFVVAQPPSANDLLLDSGVAVVRLNLSRAGPAILALSREIRRVKPDVIYTGMPTMNISAVIANLLTGKIARVVISERSNPSLEFENGATWRYRFAALLQPWFYRLADARVAVSSELADDLASYSGLRRDSIQVIYNPAWNENLSCDAAVPHPWLAEEIPIVIGAGRLVPQKDFDFFLRAFAKLRQSMNVRAIVLGEGPLKAELVSRARHLGVESDVVFPGYVEDVVPWFRRSSVFALTSRWEGFGNVLVQALGAGCSIVSSRCKSGPVEILQDGVYGRLVELGDVAAFSKALEATIKNPSDPETLKSRADLFSVKRSTDRYEELFLTLSASVN